MEEPENANGRQPQAQDCREMPRCAVDEEATLLLLSHGSAMPCRMVELGLGGCQMVLGQRIQPGLQTAVETNFKINGIAFRLSGVTEETSGGNRVGVSFGPMSARRRDDLVEVLCEVEAANAAKAAQSRETGTGSEATLAAGSEPAEKASEASAPGGQPAPAPVESRTVQNRSRDAGPALVAADGNRGFRLLDFLFRRGVYAAPASAREDRISAVGRDRSPQALPTGPENMGLESAPAAGHRPVLVARTPPSGEMKTASRQSTGSSGLQEPPTTGDEPAATQPAPAGRDRRTARRCTVDTSAVIYLIKIGSKMTGQILDLSQGGCRIRTAERFPVGIYTRVETEFNLQGLPLRLGGVIQAIHDRNLVGIRFLDVSTRKREQVAELIQEIAGAEDEGAGN